MCSKIDASQQDKKFLLEQIFELGIGSALGTKMGGGQTSRPDNRTESHTKISHAKMPVTRPKHRKGRKVCGGLLRRGLFRKGFSEEPFFRKGLAPLLQTARPEAWLAVSRGFWRNR